MLASSPGQSYWLALFVDDMIAGTGLGRTTFSMLYALATVFSAGAVLVVGGLVERRGTAVAWTAVVAGLAAGSLLMSAADGALLALAALALLRACGQGSFPLLGTLLIARSFDAWRGRVLSGAYLGSTLAAALLPPVAAVLVSAHGWRGALQLTALAVICLFGPLALAVRRVDPPPRRRPGGTPLAGRWAAARSRAARFPWRDGGALLLVSLCAVPLVSTAAVFHATSLLAASGLGLGAAAAVLSMKVAVGALGALVGGALVDKAGVRASLVAMNVLLGVGIMFVLLDSPLGGYGGFALIGVANGLNGTASGAAWASAFGLARLPELQSVGDSARIAAAAIGPLPLAFGLSLTGSYTVGLVALAGFSFACAAAGARLTSRTSSPRSDPPGARSAGTV